VNLVWCRWIPVWVVLCVAVPRAFGANAESRAFDLASRALVEGNFALAEARFAEFAQTYSNSTRLPSNYLFQAEARIKQAKYSSAIELLTAHRGQAGSWADQYLFWLAQAWYQQQEHRKACDLFGELLDQFPRSSRRLEAAVGQALALSKLGEWPRVSQLLEQTNGAFQIALRGQPPGELTAQGSLLLGEAWIEQNNFSQAESLLQPLQPLSLKPELAWKRRYLLCRISQAGGRLESALDGTADLARLAAATAQIDLQAISTALRGGLLEQLFRPEEAIAAYTNNLVAGIPGEYQRQALWKVTELALAQNQVARAGRGLEEFLGKYPDAPPADYARLRLGELQLLQYRSIGDVAPNTMVGTNSVSTTNLLTQAIDSLQRLITQFPSSSHYGRAQLGLGWCYWLQTNFSGCESAFGAAVDRLPVSMDQATAYFKLADAQFRLSKYSEAVKNYQAVADKFTTLPQVQTNLVERSLYQVIRSGLAAGDLASATNALVKLLAAYPASYRTEGALLLAGQAISRQGDPAGARELFLQVASLVTNSPLLPQIQLAVAQTYEEEKDWIAAIRYYDEWLVLYTNSDLCARVQYYCGQANARAGRYTNTLACFASLTTRFPSDNNYGPQAQLWVADYYYGVIQPPDFIAAETNYQILYKNTNWHRPELTSQARLMAGRAALNRGGWSDAEGCFTNLTSDLECPLWTQAMLAYGDTLRGRASESTNKISDYVTASRVYERIREQFPTNPVAMIALGEQASCLLQLADFTNAASAFQCILTNSLSSAALRSTAAIGLAGSFELMARQRNGMEQTNLLEQALDLYLDVLHGKASIVHEGETPDMFATLKAGYNAASLLEGRKEWDRAIQIYKDMASLFPPMQSDLEKKILRAERNKSAPDRKTSPLRG
jgi:TolA-binding protein